MSRWDFCSLNSPCIPATHPHPFRGKILIGALSFFYQLTPTLSFPVPSCGHVSAHSNWFVLFELFQLSAAFTLSKAVIPLTLEPLSVPSTSLLKDHLAIRFYTKPQEVKVTMGFWAEHKFHELLMRLSYLRVLPDERIVTKGMLQ